MRAIRTAVKGLIPLAVIVALMAIPSVASAAPAKWTEYDGDPIGTVTADITGNIDIELVGVGTTVTATCEVTGEIELSNGGAGGTAIQEVVSLQPVDADGPGPYVCEGYWYGYPASQVTYSTPWTGSTTTGYPGTTFGNFQMTTTWGGPGGFTAPTAGSLPLPSYQVQVQGRSCIGGFAIYQASLPPSIQNPYNTNVTATLDLDLNTLQGLSTNQGGPCVKRAAA
jgi:hypothetical protein